MKYVCDICGYVYRPRSRRSRQRRRPRHALGSRPRRLGLPAVRRRQGPVQPRSITQNEKRKPVTRLPFFALRARIYIVGKLTTDAENATLRLSYDRKRGRCGGGKREGKTMKYCSQCGAQLVDEAVVCPQCGCPVQPQRSVDPNASPEIAPDRAAAVRLCRRSRHPPLLRRQDRHGRALAAHGRMLRHRRAGRPDHDRLRHIHRQRRKAGHRLADLNAAQKIAPRPDGRGAFCTFYGSISMM